MDAFLTGSHTYGQPNANSDIDLVIRADPDTKQKLLELSGGSFPIKFGNLNLIVAVTDSEYSAWSLARQTCLDSVSQSGERLDKDTCIAIHDRIRTELGVIYGGESSHNQK